MAAALTRVVQEVVRRSGAAEPSGAPLYAYRVTDAELDEIREHLRTTIDLGLRFGEEDCAAFCLYAAERFCRTHTGGAWKWETILESIGVSGYSGHLYKVVELGLRFWRRPILRNLGWREFLVTIACEGGLPLHVVRQEHTRLRQYFRKVLLAREQYVLTPTRELAARLDDVLPLTLRNDIVHDLTVSLIDAIAELRRDPTIREAADPVAMLDNRGVAWRQRIPLRLDDAVAAALLQGLLTERATLGVLGMAFRLELVLQGDRPLRVARHIVFQPVVDETALRRQLGGLAVELPVRFRLDVVDDLGRRVCVATALRRYGGDGSYSITPFLRPDADLGIAWGGDSQVVATADGVEFARSSIPGLPPTEAIPWVLNPDASPPRCIGFGSARSAAAELLAIIDATTTREGPPAEDLGELELAGAEPRRVWRFRDEQRFHSNAGTFVVRPGAQEVARTDFVLCGVSSRIGDVGSLVWRGAPAVLESTEGAPSRRVEESRIEWFQRGAGGGPRRHGAAPPYGAWWIRVHDGQATVFQAPVTIVPDSFRCHLEPIPGGVEARVRFRHTGGAHVEPEAQRDGAEWRVAERDDDIQVSIAVRSGSEPPAFVSVPLAWPGAGRTRLTLPFPRVFEGFLRSETEILGRGTMLSLGDVTSIRARVVQPTSRGSFLLEAQSRDGRRELLTMLPQLVAGRAAEPINVWELPLHAVQERLAALVSADSGLDSVVDIRIGANDGTSTRDHAHVRVGRYSQRLVIKREDAGSLIGVCVTDEAGAAVREDALRGLRLVAKPLWDLRREPETLPSAGPGEWAFETAQRDPGAWMLTGWVGEVPRARPTIVEVGDRSVVPDRGPLDTAMHAPADQRDATLADLLAAMVVDPGHVGWRELHDVLAEATELPAGTFDVVRTMIGVPAACALAWVHFHDRPWFPRFWDALEALPFLWSTIPIASWIRSVQRHREATTSSLVSAGLPAGDADRLMDDAGRRLSESIRLRAPFGDVVALLLWRSSGRNPPRAAFLGLCDGPRAVSSRIALRDAALQGLLHRHVDATWPDERIVQNLRDDPVARAWCPDPERSDRVPVVAAPIVAAAAAVRGRRLDTGLMSRLQLLRAFDRTYYDEMHAITLTHLVSTALSQDPGAFDA